MAISIQRCSECVLSSAFPRIQFDEDGVCNFCRNTLKQVSDRSVLKKEKDQVVALIDSVRGKNEYDAIVCYSGGKDSTYTLKLAVEKYDLRVCTFTFDNGFLSDGVMNNIVTVTDRLGIDHIMLRIAKGRMNRIIVSSALHPIYSKTSLVRISSVCNSCISIVNMAALRMALEKNVPLIIAGFTLGQIPVNAVCYRNNYTFLEESRMKSIRKLVALAGDDIENYFRLPQYLVDKTEVFPANLNLLCLEDISEHEIIKNISGLGWKAPGDVDGCSSNCRLNAFNNYVHKKINGYSPYELELSHLVRMGQLAREEALEKLTTQPGELIRKVMEELSITEQDVSHSIA